MSSANSPRALDVLRVHIVLHPFAANFEELPPARTPHGPYTESQIDPREERQNNTYVAATISSTRYTIVFFHWIRNAHRQPKYSHEVLPSFSPMKRSATLWIFTARWSNQSNSLPCRGREHYAYQCIFGSSLFLISKPMYPGWMQSISGITTCGCQSWPMNDAANSLWKTKLIRTYRRSSARMIRMHVNKPGAPLLTIMLLFPDITWWHYTVFLLCIHKYKEQSSGRRLAETVPITKDELCNRIFSQLQLILSIKAA